jgi:hypothetical protein
MLKIFFYAVVAVLLIAGVTSAAEERNSVVYDGVSTEVTASIDAGKNLWISMDDLKRATHFVVKPQGVCRDELCFPLPAKRKPDFLSMRGGVVWFNLTAFAALVKQPVIRDEKNAVWFFGKRVDERGTFLASREAPNFSLPDLNGKMHSLADYRGKKVLLITWASW